MYFDVYLVNFEHMLLLLLAEQTTKLSNGNPFGVRHHQNKSRQHSLAKILLLVVVEIFLVVVKFS